MRIDHGLERSEEHRRGGRACWRIVAALTLVAACTDGDGNQFLSADIDAPAIDAPEIDAPPPDAPVCIPVAAEPPDNCPDGGCPHAFTTDPARVCPTNAYIKQPITFFTDCEGLDVIWYHGVDTAEVIYFRTSDGSFLGYQRVSANFGGSQTCVVGVPAGFAPFISCPAHTTIVCNRP